MHPPTITTTHHKKNIFSMFCRTFQLINILIILPLILTPFTALCLLAVKLKFKKIDELYSFIVRKWARQLRKALNIQHHINVPLELDADQILVTCNHQSYLDILISYAFWIEYNHVPRFVFKRSLLLILPHLVLPSFFVKNISINRSNRNMAQAMRSLQKTFSGNPDILIIFAESTRFKPHKRKRYKHLCNPKPTALNFILNNWRKAQPQKTIDWLDFCIHYPVEKNFLLELLKGNISFVHIHIRKLTSLPPGEDAPSLKESTKILTRTWANNDQWLEQMNNQTDTCQ